MSINIKDKSLCCGCEACVQVCAHHAIQMQEDSEGFRYPFVNQELCVECGLCEKVCQYLEPVAKHQENQRAFGGHINDEKVLNESTSGGAFSAIVNYWCDENYVIFGAESKGLDVFHSYITDKKELFKYRRSKYSQSVIGDAYKNAKQFLREGRKVLFSGTPCQIAGLKSYLGKTDQTRLLTVEVVCEGVPSPLYVRKMEKHFINKYGAGIHTIDYRYKSNSIFSKGRWDFEKMFIKLASLSWHLGA